ncbi:hypothetical protein PIB30_061787 [Stylosanthes scabra]|uniref:Uncharacterized protein n=1 Tax=Stylosanthes scabra TaxID=79078 RepID=A0ABU6RLU3_9FABA|nr:hypothetical protein [Stylosanthes scabra]
MATHHHHRGLLSDHLSLLTPASSGNSTRRQSFYEWWRRQHGVQPPPSRFPSLPLFSTDGGGMGTAEQLGVTVAWKHDGDKLSDDSSGVFIGVVSSSLKPSLSLSLFDFHLSLLPIATAAAQQPLPAGAVSSLPSSNFCVCVG